MCVDTFVHLAGRIGVIFESTDNAYVDFEMLAMAYYGSPETFLEFAGAISHCLPFREAGLNDTDVSMTNMIV
jgi:hypothetical protein